MDASDLWDANATRYLEAIGLTILLYDHVLTFAGEVRLIWFAPTSFVKYTFLFNRYLVLATLITVAVGQRCVVFLAKSSLTMAVEHSCSHVP